MKSITYELVELLKGTKKLKNKWVFRLKKNGNENLLKYKILLLEKGFRKKNKIFLAVAWLPFLCVDIVLIMS